MAEDDDASAGAAAGHGNRENPVHRLVERERHTGADAASGGEPDMGDQHVSAGLDHGDRLLRSKDVGRGE